MRRRRFLTGLGSAAAAWPLSARAQQVERVRRVGLLLLYRVDEPFGQVRLQAFVQALEKLGWIVGRNLQIDARSKEEHYGQTVNSERYCGVGVSRLAR